MAVNFKSHSLTELYTGIIFPLKKISFMAIDTKITKHKTIGYVKANINSNIQLPNLI